MPLNHIPKASSLVSLTAPGEGPLLWQDLSAGGREGGPAGGADTQACPCTNLCMKRFLSPSWSHAEGSSPGAESPRGQSPCRAGAGGAEGLTQRSTRWKGESLQLPPSCQLPVLKVSFLLLFQFQIKKKQVIQWQHTASSEILQFLYRWDVWFSWFSMCVLTCLSVLSQFVRLFVDDCCFLPICWIYFLLTVSWHHADV